MPHWERQTTPSQLNLPKHFLNWVYFNKIKIFLFCSSEGSLYLQYRLDWSNMFLFTNFPCLSYILFLAYFLLFMLFICQGIKNRWALRIFFTKRLLCIFFFFFLLVIFLIVQTKSTVESVNKKQIKKQNSKNKKLFHCFL